MRVDKSMEWSGRESKQTKQGCPAKQNRLENREVVYVRMNDLDV